MAKFHRAGGGQREDRAGAGDGKADALLLRRLLRILLLIGRRVGHGEREAVDQLGVTTLPEPSGLGLLLDLLGDLDGQIVQGLLGELGPGAAVVPRVGRRRRPFGQRPMDDDIRDGRLAGRFLAVAEHLSQKRPQGHHRGIDRGHAEQVVVLGENPLDPFRRENLGERQPRLRQQRVRQLPKTGMVAVPRTCYREHEKTVGSQ